MRGRCQSDHPGMSERDDGAVGVEGTDLEAILEELAEAGGLYAAVYRIARGSREAEYLERLELSAGDTEIDILERTREAFGSGRFRYQIRRVGTKGVLRQFERTVGGLGGASEAAPAAPQASPADALLAQMRDSNAQLLEVFKATLGARPADTMSTPQLIELLTKRTPASELSEMFEMVRDLQGVAGGDGDGGGGGDDTELATAMVGLFGEMMASRRQQAQPARSGVARKKAPRTPQNRREGLGDSEPDQGSDTAGAATEGGQIGTPAATQAALVQIITQAAHDPRGSARSYARSMLAVAPRELRAAVAMLTQPGTLTAKVLADLPELAGFESRVLKIEDAIRTEIAAQAQTGGDDGEA